LIIALFLSTTAASASHHQHRHHKGHHHHHHAAAPSYRHKPTFDQFIGLGSSEYQKVQSIVDEKGILEKV